MNLSSVLTWARTVCVQPATTKNDDIFSTSLCKLKKQLDPKVPHA